MNCFVSTLFGCNASGKSHRQVFEELRQHGIGVNLPYMPVYLQPYCRALGFVAGQYPQAEAYGKEATILPMYPGLTDQEQGRVVSTLKQVLTHG